MILKKGSKGKYVARLQDFLKILADGIFGPGTERAVKKWQYVKGLASDGIVGPITWRAMGLDEDATTDNSETLKITSDELVIEQYYLPKGEYLEGPTNKEYLFLHHTAGWHNPFRTIDHWGRDTRGRVATEFVLGGQSIKGNDESFDGKLVQCMPEGAYGWHLGKNGSQHMHTHSVGIEVNNFGYIVDGKTYAGTTAHPDQVIALKKEFRGHRMWHRYSDAQISVLHKFILYIANRDNIDVRDGLYRWIKERGADAFEFNEDAYYGRVRGLLTHTNTRKTKFDMFPQPELLDMILSL